MNISYHLCRLLPHAGAPGRGSMPPSPCYSSEDVISCQLTRSVQCAHQKPITVLRAAAGRVVTGSQDHTVRVTERVLMRIYKTNMTQSHDVHRYYTCKQSLNSRVTSVFVRFIAWRTPAAFLPCRVILEGSQQSI